MHPDKLVHMCRMRIRSGTTSSKVIRSERAPSVGSIPYMIEVGSIKEIAAAVHSKVQISPSCTLIIWILVSSPARGALA